MRVSNQIVFASTNGDKFREMRALLSRFPEVELISPIGLVRNADKIGYVESFDTYSANAAAKARLVNQGCHYPTLADDSGIEIMRLEGRPGVHSRRYAQMQGSPSQISQDRANIEKVLQELQGSTNREARFVTSLVLVIEGILIQASGSLEGTIAEAPRGNHGFGYDPLFIPKGETRTLAEMTETEKNALSHRARALDEIMAQVKYHGIVFAKP